MADLAQSPVVPVLAWTLVHFLWQGAVIALLAWAAMRVCASSASRRYGVGVAALAAMVLAPLVTFTILAAPARAITSGHVLQTPNTSALAPVTTAPGLPVAELVSTTSGTASWMLAALVIVWMTGVLIFAVRLLGGWMVARRLARRAVRPAAAHIQALAERMATRLAVRRAVRIVESSAVAVPVLVGWIAPVVVLPVAALVGLSPVQIEALIAHELAHVRRHDYLVNVLQALVEVVLFYHPAVWWMSRRIRAERELCCDDLAVGVCDRLVYATALTDLAELVGPRLALAATDGDLVSRVRRILGADVTPGPARWTPAVLLTLVGVVILPVAMASATDKPLAAPPPAQAATPTGANALAPAEPQPSAEPTAAGSPVAATARLLLADGGEHLASDRQATSQTEQARLLAAERVRQVDADRALEAAERQRAAQAQIEGAQRHVERMRQLFATGLITSAEFRQAEADLARLQARGDREVAQSAEIAALERHLEDLRVVAEIGTRSQTEVADMEATLARIREVQAEQATIADVQSQLDVAVQQLDRAKELFARGLVTSAALKDAEAKMEFMRQRLQAQQAALEATEQQRQKAEQAIKEIEVRRQEVEAQQRRIAARPRPETEVDPDPGRPIAFGDVLSIVIAGEPDLPAMYPVTPEGTIRMLFLGTFQVAGQTTVQVRQAIGKQLADRRLGTTTQVSVTLQRAIRRVR